MKFGTPPTEVEVNIPTRAALFRAVKEKFIARDGFALATLNLDHLTKLPRQPDFLAAYRAHDLVVADGRPIVWLSRLAGRPLELMPGSDMILPLCDLAAETGVPVALVGSSQHALEGASDALVRRTPGLNIVHLHAPPYGFDPAGAEADALLDAVAASGAGLCFVALGAPKQEILAARGRDRAPRVGFASIGAGLDFLSGHQVRAPRLMRMLALEWLWRALQSPRRMVPRYAKCLMILPGLTRQALRRR
ncbi:glycosyltransferase [Sulfitobacter alexandrii]|uniref:Glycosyltransferase n=1 Tax=Sulfitobacter alexandrii TaxID=1917485 RepID=A0A1J0WFK5_9RHOB|nr:WecB/TagA/CpsF family glycosyltransferase [Sulfitobacter alexandrii]APE42968.1 glycosyltransferase [Sulfitobacter alexandrii]